MLIIGEKINTTLKGIDEIISRKDAKSIQELARKQIKACADMIDVNVGTRVKTEAEDMEWAIRTIQEAVDTPICIDSPNPRVIERGLRVHKGKALVNSTTAEKERLEEIRSVIREYDCGIIALTMDDEGIPEDAEGRYRIAAILIEKLTKEGVDLEDIYIDPLVRPISTDSNVGKSVLDAIEKISSSFHGIHIVCGLSNISFGLPKRPLLNRVFLAMAMAKGLDAAIVDPLDKELVSCLIAAKALLGQDEFCTNYISAFREGKL